jgi:transposase
MIEIKGYDIDELSSLVGLPFQAIKNLMTKYKITAIATLRGKTHGKRTAVYSVDALTTLREALENAKIKPTDEALPIQPDEVSLEELSRMLKLKVGNLWHYVYTYFGNDVIHRVARGHGGRILVIKMDVADAVIEKIKKNRTVYSLTIRPTEISIDELSAMFGKTIHTMRQYMHKHFPKAAVIRMKLAGYRTLAYKRDLIPEIQRSLAVEKRGRPRKTTSEFSLGNLSETTNHQT